MGYVFQAKWWEKHPSGCSLWFIMAKGNWQRQCQSGIYWNLFMKKIELGEREGERSKVAREEENEEIRGLIDEKSYEVQLVYFCLDFCHFSFGALILFSLSLILLDT